MKKKVLLGITAFAAVTLSMNPLLAADQNTAWK